MILLMKEYCRVVDHNRIKEDGNFSARSNLKHGSSSLLEITSKQPFTADRSMYCCVPVCSQKSLVLLGKMTETK